MDTLLPQLLAFPPHPPPEAPLSDAEYTKQIRFVIDVLGSTPANQLTGAAKGSGNLLDILDPSLNSLPYLYTLLAHISSTTGKQKSNSASEKFVPGTPLWLKMEAFMHSFDSVQIRYSGHELRRLIDLTILGARKANTPKEAIVPIQTAILRVDPSGSTLTSSHLSFVTLCLETRNFASALSVLDKDIYFLPPSSARQNDTTMNPLYPYPCSTHSPSATYITPGSGLTTPLQYQDYLTYFLYGGMIYIGLRNWERAQSFFDIVVSCPTLNAISKIQVEAFKKLVLVTLLATGKVADPPRNTNQQTAKACQALAKPYVSLAKIFKASIESEEGSQKLLAEADIGTPVWQEDTNTGIVEQVIYAFRQFSVQHLEDTYGALTIADVARLTSPDPKDYAETGQFVVGLIASGQLKASISHPSEDPRTWIVRFAGDAINADQSYPEEQQYEEVQRQAQRVDLLMAKVTDLDCQLRTSKEYVNDSKRSKKAKNDGGGFDDATSFPPAEIFDQDEEMMGDL